MTCSRHEPMRVFEEMNTTISQAKELPKLAKQLMTYKPHSRVMPRVDAVKLWKELPSAITEDYWVDGACIITFDWHFQFVAKGNRTVVRWVKHVTKEEHDQQVMEGLLDASREEGTPQ